MGGGGALVAVGHRHPVLPLSGAEMAGGHGRQPLGESPRNEQGPQGQGFPHGGAGPVEPVKGDVEIPQAEGRADALVEQVPRQHVVQLSRREAPLLQRPAEGDLLHRALRLLPGLLSEKAVLAEIVKISGQGTFPLLLAAHGGVGEDDRRFFQGHRLPPQSFLHGLASKTELRAWPALVRLVCAFFPGI